MGFAKIMAKIKLVVLQSLFGSFFKRVIHDDAAAAIDNLSFVDWDSGFIEGLLLSNYLFRKAIWEGIWWIISERFYKKRIGSIKAEKYLL